MKLDPTIERLNFSSYSDTTVEHLHRYAITQEFIKNKEVLDIASGEGYGTFLMGKLAKKVYGVDIDAGAIEDSKKKYNLDNLEFLEGSADCIPLQANSVDVVVSFETIEHHDKHNEMFREIVRVLKPDGIMIMSSPDKTYYSDKTGYKNKFHVKELSFKEFKLLTESYFKNSDFYFQKAYNMNSFIAKSERYKLVKVYSGDQKEIYTKMIEPVYNIVIASQLPIEELKESIYNGQKFSNLRNKQIEKEAILNVRKSISFKIGQFILKPLKVFVKK